MLEKYHFGLNLHLRGLVLASLVAEGLVGVPHLSSKEDRKLVVQRDTLGGLGVSSGWHPTTLA